MHARRGRVLCSGARGSLRRRQHGDSEKGAPHRTRLRAALAGAWLLAFAGAASAQERREFRELHMGMEVRIVVYARDDAHSRAAARAAFDRIARLEDIMSDWRPESEARRLERRAGAWVAVSPELFGVLALAVDVARRSDGAFDPTAGPLVALWREARRTARLPSPRALDSARALVGWRQLELDSATGPRVRLGRPGMRLDLGGVAKGFILQEAVRTLQRAGIVSALVEAGGDVTVSRAPPGVAGWHIEAPHGDSLVQQLAAQLSAASVATSGPSGQFVEIDGRRYSHVVDARSGTALTTPTHATVIATDAALADALATALTIVAAAERKPLMESFGRSVIAWSTNAPSAP